jgi:hypothetical protein
VTAKAVARGEQMAKNLGASVLALLAHDRPDLRAAAATVLAAVGKGDDAVARALSERLDDPDPVVRRVVLDGLASIGATSIAPRLVPLLGDGDDELAARAAALLATQGASAEGALRKQLGHGSPSVRRTIAQLLLHRGTQPAVEAVLDQLADAELGEPMLQLVRAALDDGASKLAATVEKLGLARAADVGKRLQKEWARAQKGAAAPAAKKSAKGTKADGGRNGHPPDPLRDGAVAPLVAELGLLLRLIGYLARPSSQALLLGHAAVDRPRPIRLAAIAGLRRIVAASGDADVEAAIEAMIDYAGQDDLTVAQAAVDTLRGARIPERLVKPFAALARSKNSAAQTLAMERLPAGGGAGAVKALVDAIAGDDAPARDAASRGLAKAPEAVLPMVRALVATTDEAVARRYAAALRAHRGHVAATAVDELVAAARRHVDLHGKGKATADTILIERVLLETLADVAPAQHVELLFEHARRLRRAGKPIEAYGTLKPLLRGRAELDAAMDDEQRFLLAVLGLEAAGDSILRAAHADDPVLGLFGRLAHSGFPVAKKLAREKDVSDEAIYGLGFRLIESQGNDDQGLGADLLTGIVEERPRSRLARAARNKLKLAGYED